MALKKTANPSSKKEQLYMLEFFIDRLCLCSQSTIGLSINDFIVRIEFVDLAPFNITKDVSSDTIKEEDNQNKENSDPIENSYNFNCGKSCLFTKSSKNLVASIRTMPLKIKLYGKDKSSSESLLGQTEVTIPSVLCNRIASFKWGRLPASYTIENVFQLKNSDDITALMSAVLKLSCLGDPGVKDDDELLKNPKMHVFPGVSRSTQRMKTASMYQQQEEQTFTLTRPASPPRVSINERGFESLTFAEKLNDPKFRDLIYKAYPHESTCSCSPSDKGLHPMKCRSGCERSCCMKLRNPQALMTVCESCKDTSPFVRICCEDGSYPKVLLNKSEKESEKESNRMRGGAGEDDYLMNDVTGIGLDDTVEFTWYGDKIAQKTRLEGGGEYDLPGCVCLGAPSLYEKPDDTVKSCCKPRQAGAETAKPGCTCAGTDSPVWRQGGSTCSKNPCTGIDCLLRAFKEAQEFVDSLGKVPGLVGLGLMDPSESPYFGRDLDQDYAGEDSGRKVLPPQTISPNPQCTAACNMQLSARPTGISTVSLPYSTPAYPPPSPLTTSIPGRTGVVREAVPMLPETTANIISMKPRRRDEKKDDRGKEIDMTPSIPLDIELGPCGEPKCKSRRKVGKETEVNENTDTGSKKSGTQTNKTSGATSRVSEKTVRYKRNSAPASGPSDRGDRISRGPIKLSKRVVRYVYSLGDVYPGVNYGHKNCIDVRMRVPANMGWLWNTKTTLYNMKPRIGWKPGAIGRYLSELLREAKAGSVDSRPRSAPSRSRRSKTYRSMSFASVQKKLQGKKDNEEETELPPTLHIHRKDGTYYVTMYPIKPETKDVPQLEEPMKPLQFKIVKNKDDESEASSSAASDMEIEFSPPAAVNRYRKKPDVVHTSTQVRQQEIIDACKPADMYKKDKKIKKEVTGGKKGRR